MVAQLEAHDGPCVQSRLDRAAVQTMVIRIDRCQSQSKPQAKIHIRVTVGWTGSAWSIVGSWRTIMRGSVDLCHSRCSQYEAHHRNQ